MKLLERIAMVLVIAFIVAMLISAISRFDLSFGRKSLYQIAYWVIGIIGLLLRGGCGWWLYRTTKPKQQYPWLWCLLGVVFGLMAIATYYLMEIYRKICTPERITEET
jgi:hypothetical protein